jgi:hypothetical protein
MRRAVTILALAVGWLVALSDPTWAFRKSQAEVDELLHAKDRFVDFGVVLKVVNKDSNGEELLPGRPRMRVLREHRFGGVYDTLSRKWTGPTRHPVEWLSSEEQEPILLHPDSMPGSIWMQGSMGAGKTKTGAMWSGLRVIRHALRKFHGGAGITAPTDDRLEPIRIEVLGPKVEGKRIGGLWPRSWYSWSEGGGTCVFATGLQVDFRTSSIASAELGSPFQGYNWPAFVWNDELQDYFRLDGDIQMRMRGAWNGRQLRFCTVTPKDDPEYRTFRSKVETSEHWHRHYVSILRSPFIHDSELAKYRDELPPREYRRKILGLDVGPERMLYPTWARSDDFGRPLNLRPVPIGAEDVTAQVLRHWGQNIQVLVGHDPGRRYHVSVLLKAYRIPSLCPTAHVWFIVDEVTSEQTTIEQHVEDLLLALRDRHHVEQLNWKGEREEGSARALVRLDPYSNSASGEKRPAKTVPASFRSKGLMALSGAYQVTRNGSVSSGTIPKEARINMMCRLLAAESGNRRLYVACDDRGTPYAPRVVESFERSERDEAYEAEEVKGPSDVSHWTAATGYALWVLEKPRDDGSAARRRA